METLEYSYKPKPWAMALASSFFAACTLGMVHAARANDRGLILNGIIEFSATGATTFYWWVAGVSALFVLAGMAGLAVSVLAAQRLRLTATEIAAPRSVFSREATVVPLADVEAIDVQTIQRQRLMNVRHARGKFSIAQSLLPDAAAFDALHHALEERVARSRR